VIDEAQQLFKSYRFDEAVVAYERKLSSGLGDRWANTGGLGRALMAAGRYAEAVPFLVEVGAHEKAQVPGALGRDLELSICEWLAGNREQGLIIMRSLVVGARDGTITYATDLVGGLSQGLLLHYMAVALGSTEERQLSVAYIKKLAKSAKAKHWPGPVGKFIVGEMQWAEALMLGVGVSDLAEAKQIATTDLLKRRRLTNVLFNVAVSCRVSGDETGCQDWMRACAALQNPLIEYDWHLARAEAVKSQ
jgi:hypothetical protein